MSDLDYKSQTNGLRRRFLPFGGAALLYAFLAAFLILPIVLAISSGFFYEHKLTSLWFVRTVTDGNNLRNFGNGLVLACCTTLVAMAIALPPAILRARYKFRGQGTLGVLMLAPMLLPPFVGALSMRHLFSQFGAFNLLLERVGVLDFSRSLPPDWLGTGFAGVVALQALHLFPILYLNASAAMANIDPAYGQAARNLGAGPWRTFFKVTLPLIRPGLFAGGTIVFIWAFTDIGTPAILGYDQLVPVVVFKELAKSDTSPSIFSLVFVLLGSSVTLYVLGKFFFGRGLSGETAKASSAAETRRLGPIATAGAWTVFGVVLLAALMPHIGVVLTAISGRWVNTVLPDQYTLSHLQFVFNRQETLHSVQNSVVYSSISTLADLLLGFLGAWLIVRTRIFGRTLLDGLMMLPLAVPGIIVAAGYVAITARGPLQAIGPRGEWVIVIIVVAYAVRRLPFAVRGVSAGLQQVPASLEEAARNLGASPAGAAFRITLPLIAANIVAAGVLTFAFAMLEVSDSLILAQKDAGFPITKEIYTQAVSGNVDAANIASALGVYGMIFLGGTMAAASALMGKRLGAIFRA